MRRKRPRRRRRHRDRCDYAPRRQGRAAAGLGARSGGAPAWQSRACRDSALARGRRAWWRRPRGFACGGDGGRGLRRTGRAWWRLHGGLACGGDGGRGLRRIGRACIATQSPKVQGDDRLLGCALSHDDALTPSRLRRIGCGLPCRGWTCILPTGHGLPCRGWTCILKGHGLLFLRLWRCLRLVGPEF